jgi:hypothetical protein
MLRMKRYVVVVAAVTVPIVAAALILVLLGGPAGASSAGDVPGLDVTMTSPPSKLRTSAVAAAPTPSSPTLEDGRHFGFIRSVELRTSPETISFDLAYRLDGEEANQAAAERGYPTPVDNDYFVVNDNPKLRTVTLSPSAEILLVDWNRCCEDFVTVDPERFQASFGLPEYSSLHPQGEFSQYWVTVAGGIVVKIEEQYRP